MEKRERDYIWFKGGTCMVVLKWDKKKELKVFFSMLAHHTRTKQQQIINLECMSILSSKNIIES